MFSALNEKLCWSKLNFESNFANLYIHRVWTKMHIPWGALCYRNMLKADTWLRIIDAAIDQMCKPRKSAATLESVQSSEKAFGKPTNWSIGYLFSIVQIILLLFELSLVIFSLCNGRNMHLHWKFKSGVLSFFCSPELGSMWTYNWATPCIVQPRPSLSTFIPFPFPFILSFITLLSLALCSIVSCNNSLHDWACTFDLLLVGLYSFSVFNLNGFSSFKHIHIQCESFITEISNFAVSSQGKPNSFW